MSLNKSCEKKQYTWNIDLILPYSSSDNLTPPISRVLIGRHLIFSSLTSPTCCNPPVKCTSVKYNARQKAGHPTVCHIDNLLRVEPWKNNIVKKFWIFREIVIAFRIFQIYFPAWSFTSSIYAQNILQHRKPI